MPVKLDFLLSDHPLLVRPGTLEHRVLSSVSECEVAPPAEIAEHTGLSPNQVYRTLRRLREKELVEKSSAEYRLSGELAQLHVSSLVA